MIILYVYFVQNGTTTQNFKKNENRLKKKKHIFRLIFFFHVILDMLYNLNVNFQRMCPTFLPLKLTILFFYVIRIFFGLF
jgi:hypothetical protein